MDSPRKKSNSSKGRRKAGRSRGNVRAACRGATAESSRAARRGSCPKRSLSARVTPQRSVPTAPVTRREARAIEEMGIPLRAGIERDTLLMPWVIADSVLGEASRFLNAELPEEWADWLDQRAERCYARREHFRRLIRQKENAGRDYLYLFFRHWLAAKIKRERRGLYRKLPRDFGLGKRLPAQATNR